MAIRNIIKKINQILNRSKNKNPEEKDSLYLSEKISPKHYFYLKDGQIIKSLREIPVVLRNVDEYIFEKHVSENKNDFADWIEHVFGLNELANRISDIKTKQELIRKIQNHLKEREQERKNKIKEEFTNKYKKVKENLDKHKIKPKEQKNNLDQKSNSKNQPLSIFFSLSLSFKS